MSTIISDMVSHLQCGVAIAANDAVYINSADGKIYKYDPLQPLQVYAGIAKEAGLLNAFIRVVQSGRVKGFSGLTPGAFVYASVTVPGGFQLTDPGSSLKVVLGIAKSATELTVNGALGIKTGGGTGSGGINYILNPDADTTVGWATYADAGGVTPVDGTGGSPTVTLTRSTSSPLRGTASFLYTKPASNVQGQGFSYDFTIDPADCGKVLQGSFDYQIASGTFVDDAMTIWIYDITNARLTQPAPTKLKNSGIIERFPFEFQTSIDSTSYRLIIHQSSTSAVASTIKFDNFKVGPTAKAYGSAVTDWVSFTPVWQNVVLGTGSIATAMYRRVGDTMEIQGALQLGTGGSVTGLFGMTPPTGFSVDLAKLNSADDNNVPMGSAILTDFSVSAAYPAVAAYTSARSQIEFTVQSGTGIASASIPFVWAASDSARFVVKIPITGWSSSQIMSSDANVSVTAYTVGKAAGNHTANNSYQDVIGYNSSASIDKGGISFNATTGVATITSPGQYSIKGNVAFVGTASGFVGAIILKNGVNYLTGSSSPNNTIIGGASSVSGDIDLIAGDTIKMQAFQSSGGSLAYQTGANTFISISRISGPSQIAASESVSALYTGAPPTGTLGAAYNVVKFGTKVNDSHGAYNPATGEYTVPMSGAHDISSQVFIQATFSVAQQSSISIYVDGVLKYENTVYSNGTGAYMSIPINIKSIPLTAGQVITIRPWSSGTSPSYLSNTGFNFFSITRSGNY